MTTVLLATSPSFASASGAYDILIAPLGKPVVILSSLDDERGVSLDGAKAVAFLLVIQRLHFHVPRRQMGWLDSSAVGGVEFFRNGQGKVRRQEAGRRKKGGAVLFRLARKSQAWARTARSWSSASELSPGRNRWRETTRRAN